MCMQMVRDSIVPRDKATERRGRQFFVRHAPSHRPYISYLERSKKRESNKGTLVSPTSCPGRRETSPSRSIPGLPGGVRSYRTVHRRYQTTTFRPRALNFVATLPPLPSRESSIRDPAGTHAVAIIAFLCSIFRTQHLSVASSRYDLLCERQEKTKVKALSEELENPMNVHRWRKLEGSDPTTFEMIQKIHTLQKRLISKTEEVLVGRVHSTQWRAAWTAAVIIEHRKPILLQTSSASLIQSSHPCYAENGAAVL